MKDLKVAFIGFFALMAMSWVIAIPSAVIDCTTTDISCEEAHSYWFEYNMLIGTDAHYRGTSIPSTATIKRISELEQRRYNAMYQRNEVVISIKHEEGKFYYVFESGRTSEIPSLDNRQFDTREVMQIGFFTYQNLLFYLDNQQDVYFVDGKGDMTKIGNWSELIVTR